MPEQLRDLMQGQPRVDYNYAKAAIEARSDWDSAILKAKGREAK